MPIQSTPTSRSKFTTFSAPANVFVKRLVAMLLIADAIPATNAALDMGRCCQRRARQLLEELNANPWAACGIGATITDPLKQIYAPVTATKAWAKENCPGYQLSSLDEWLEPLVQWLAPYLTLLALCPIGETAMESSEQKEKNTSILDLAGCFDVYNAERTGEENFFNRSMEWLNILGDPASAIWGAMSQIWMDFRAVQSLADPSGGPAKSMKLAISIVGNQTPMDRDNMKLPEDPATLEGQIRTVLAANSGFADGVFLPVVFHFMSTAWGFYQAYKKLGDNDTAHSLAYGALYSWLLILVVVGNCFAVRANIGALYSSMKAFPLVGKRQPLRHRYPNMFQWKRWLEDADRSTGLIEHTNDPAPNEVLPTESFNGPFYCKYIFGQLVGWAFVAFFGCCAIVISYMTPTVGWGCRSFNHLLYVVLSLVLALLQVFRQWAEATDASRSKLLTKGVRWTYASAVAVNAFVLIGGTIFHFSGLYRSYTCSRLFGPGDAIIQLAAHTEAHVRNSQRFWYSTGYVAYCVAWAVCAFAVVLRQYIQEGLRRRFATGNESVRSIHLRGSQANIEIEVRAMEVPLLRKVTKKARQK
jgi:hypothetical protein